MKKLTHWSITLLGVCAVVVAAPLSGRANPPEARKSAKKETVFDAKPSAGYRDRVVYVISDGPATGSNIPTVYRVYHRKITAMNTANRSTYFDLIASGSENVGSALARLDPAVNVNGGRY